ncbi:hypothetical protein ACFXCZ_35105 [Streptomyces sp. NPDC059396]|uniref:hypothetical protein n=1 Tax=Streptomyces sp. NPDC059396 TaxID=3346819 RepID=UPI0036BB5B7F
MVLTISGNTSVITAVAVALVAGYLLGRVRPWQRLGIWAEDRVRFTEAWAWSPPTPRSVLTRPPNDSG